MADQDIEKLRSEMAQLQEDLRSVTQTVRDMASSQGEQVYQSARDKAAGARRRAEDMERQVEEQIEERPLSSLLVVFIGGLIAGLLLHQRR
jgi:ElaB/YqjD/DUF883 family membrane-anchored ribosome-binding protein